MTSHLTKKGSDGSALVSNTGGKTDSIRDCYQTNKGKVVIDDMPARKVFAEKGDHYR